MDRMVVLAALAMLLAREALADYLTETWKTALSEEAKESSLKGRFVEVEVSEHSGETMAVYVTPPSVQVTAGMNRPVVIVAHHAVGIYHHTFLRKFADDLASHGFLVVLPDFFHRVWSDTVPHGHKMPFEKMNIRAMLGSLNDVEIHEDLRALLKWTEQWNDDKKGIVGFCMGGRIAWLAAVDPELNSKISAAVPYHGGNVFKSLGKGAQAPSELIPSNLQANVLGHFGSIDSNPSLDDMRRLQDLAGAKLKTRVYEGADHGFCCEDSAKYAESAAKQAFGSTVQYLQDHLISGRHEL